MRRFKKILFVPSARLAEPDDSFKKVVKLAADNGATLTVFGVFNDSQVSKEFLADLIYHDRLPELSALAAYAQRQNVVTDFKLVSGIPFIKIIREVLKQGHDLVVTHLVKGHGIKNWLFGGTNMHLLRKCPTPVWIMKPMVKERYQQILAAVDPLPRSPAGPSLNRSIVEMAASMAVREQGKLHLLHAWSHSEEDLLIARDKGPVPKIIRALEEAREQHKMKLMELTELAKSYNVPMETHFLEGAPSRVIPERVSQLSIDLLVMGTIARTGISGFLIGNTAEQILEQVQCPLLAVKPDGFQCPISLKN